MPQKKGIAPLKMEWQIEVPIFRNSIILKQLILAIGVPFGLVIVILAVTSGNSLYTFYALGLIASLFFFTWILLMVLYGGKYEVEYEVNEKGILCRTQAGQMKKNRIINGLAIILGILTRKPTVAGAGMLAESRQNQFIKWSDVSRIKQSPGKQVVFLYGGCTQNMAIFCKPDNYDQVVMAAAYYTALRSTE